MYKFAKLAVVALSTLILYPSCCEKKLYCTTQPLDFAFTGFTKSEASIFTLRRYYKGSNLWGAAVDSVQYRYTGAITGIKPDTLYFNEFTTSGGYSGIVPDYDWAIYLPVARQTFFITTIFHDNHTSQIVRCNDNESSCKKMITNFSINDSWQSGHFGFFQKAN